MIHRTNPNHNLKVIHSTLILDEDVVLGYPFIEIAGSTVEKIFKTKWLKPSADHPVKPKDNEAINDQIWLHLIPNAKK